MGEDLVDPTKIDSNSWLNEQSLITDSDFQETRDVRITNKRYL